MNEFANHLTISRYIAAIDEIAHSKGLRLELSMDFDELLALSKQLCGRLPLTPMFDPTVSQLGPDNGFWLKGLDAEGEVVHVQAVRKDELNGIPLANHLESLRAFYNDPASGAAPQEYCFSAAPMAQRITGTVCYHGEVWLKGGQNGFRGQGLAAVLPRMALALALAKWQPDYIYGLAWPAIVEKGLAFQYGYRNVQPHGVLWNLPMDPEPFDGWLIWMTRGDLISLMEHPRTGC